MLQLRDVRGVEHSIFQNPAKLHLTIGTLVLSGESEIFKSSQLLMKLKVEIME